MDFVEVSTEMTTLLGPCPVVQPPIPHAPIALVFHLGDTDEPPRLHLDLSPDLAELRRAAGDARIVFLVSRAAVLRIGGKSLVGSNGADFHLSSELRAIALALRDADTPVEARATYRLAKSIELLCETIRQFDMGVIVPLVVDAELSLADTRRILQARRVIDERWNEKLTLDAIARACGLNRAKLTRGFREMFDCSVAEAIAERRLSQASRLLLTTDLPVSSVGYEAGYLNNASFARAFGRHFGRSPSDYRAGALVAA
ncbi:MAG TPA: AraC family transcriptional regulator [Caulobacteraceae bacterium]|jgi:AraC family transcriptional activator of pyochelin receptor|nr:AraC family transcriptional regulator [Caulobacteraceae bacterium]